MNNRSTKSVSKIRRTTGKIVYVGNSEIVTISSSFQRKCIDYEWVRKVTMALGNKLHRYVYSTLHVNMDYKQWHTHSVRPIVCSLLYRRCKELCQVTCLTDGSNLAWPNLWCMSDRIKTGFCERKLKGCLVDWCSNKKEPARGVGINMSVTEYIRYRDTVQLVVHLICIHKATSLSTKTHGVGEDKQHLDTPLN